ncbi:aromatic amino acid transporter [Pantoea sp.]|uniref:aromatic amino acid transporter n=1 Tax=Pantoea sp. TaxID=69393 RepID=UPI0025CE0CD8|nr:aromatic amino acid transporter [Pantoea sp.]
MSETAILRRSPSVFWGATIICGTVVGAGMFILPVVMAGAWFGWSLLILAFSWICMLISGLMFHRVSQHFPLETGYDKIVRDLLGRSWAEVNGLSLIFVLGILTYAYISAIGPVYDHSLSKLTGKTVSSSEAKVILSVTVAAIVWSGTSSIGRIMSVLLVTKIILLLTLFGGLLTTVNVDYLSDSQNSSGSYWPYMLGIVPFCLASFGYHGNISGLISYYSGNHQRVKRCLCTGTAMALVIYLFWIICTMGNLPRSAFPEIASQGGDIAALMHAFSLRGYTPGMSLLFSTFSHFAVICSFVGVTAGLVDYISDRFGIATTRTGRLKAIAITFLPPLSLSLLFPAGFVAAIGYAGLLATIWAVIVPGLLHLKMKSRLSSDYQSSQWDGLQLGMIMTFAALNTLSWTLSEFDLLPVF